MLLGEPLQITHQIAGIFKKLKIDYLVGGSLASSLHGIPRATQDVDIIANIHSDQVKELVKSIQEDFYFDNDAIMEAIKHNTSFNIIHLKTMFKIDIFILKYDEGALEEMSRRKSYSFSEGDVPALYLASAEDIIIHKLYWYKLGNCISERQWLDVIGVLQVQKNQLDYSYLDKAAKRKKVTDLLKKALEAL